MLNAVGSWESLQTLRDDSVSRLAQKSQSEKKAEAVTYPALFLELC